MPKEHHEPSAEEMAKAEESMTEMQRELSSEREDKRMSQKQKNARAESSMTDIQKQLSYEREAEATMTNGQKQLSRERDWKVRALEREGIHGHLTRESKVVKSESFEGGKVCTREILLTLRGELNSHAVEVSWLRLGKIDYRYGSEADAPYYHNEDIHFQGKINGRELSQKDAERLAKCYEKYSESANDIDEQTKELDALLLQQTKDRAWDSNRGNRWELQQQEPAKARSGDMKAVLPPSFEKMMKY